MLDRAYSQAERLALLKIAERAKTDLFYLCKYILGYDGMTEATHQELCRYASALTPYSTPEDTSGDTVMNILTLDPVAAPKILENNLDVHEDGVENTGLIQEKSTSNHQIADSFDHRRNRALFLLPRGTYKSSVVTIGYSIQTILNDPDARILIDSETFSKSKAFLSEIKGHLESTEKLRQIYYVLFGSMPDSRKRDDLWTDSQINISARRKRRKEATLSCAGIDVTKTGMHYDLIIMDDLHSEKNITSKEQIDQVKTHYKLANSLIDPGKPIIIIGTRWDYNDLYQYILDYERDDFNILIKRAYNKDGSLFFPEVLTEAELERLKRRQGTYIFSCQYLNEPVDDESATFKRSMIVRKPWELVRDRPINWYLSIDPSYEGTYSDYAAFVVAGMDHQRDIYVRYVKREKMTYADIIRTMFDLFNEFDPRQIILETVATQKSIQYELNNEQRRRGTWLPVTEIKSRIKSKEERIRGLAPYYEFGHIYHVKECPQVDELEYELLHFPKGTHDDVIDALASVLEFASPTNSVAQGERKEKRNRMVSVLDKPRNPLTGV